MRSVCGCAEISSGSRSLTLLALNLRFRFCAESVSPFGVQRAQIIIRSKYIMERKDLYKLRSNFIYGRGSRACSRTHLHIAIAQKEVEKWREREKENVNKKRVFKLNFEILDEILLHVIICGSLGNLTTTAIEAAAAVAVRLPVIG